MQSWDLNPELCGVRGLGVYSQGVVGADDASLTLKLHS